MTDTRTDMMTTTRQQCRHVFTDGRRCGSPCLRGLNGPEEFCYYHHTSRRPVQNPRLRLRRQATFEMPNCEDRSAIQQGLADILDRIANNEIDPRRAGLLLYGLQIASLNLPRPKPTPELAEPEQIVDQVTFDPDLGPLAPVAEFRNPSEPREGSACAAERALEAWAATDPPGL